VPHHLGDSWLGHQGGEDTDQHDSAGGGACHW
jgi:hypothetical protein